MSVGSVGSSTGFQAYQAPPQKSGGQVVQQQAPPPPPEKASEESKESSAVQSKEANTAAETMESKSINTYA